MRPTGGRVPLAVGRALRHSVGRAARHRGKVVPSRQKNLRCVKFRVLRQLGLVRHVRGDLGTALAKDRAELGRAIVPLRIPLATQYVGMNRRRKN
jgi:hypothetical protein